MGWILRGGTCFDDRLQDNRKAVDRHGGNRISCRTVIGDITCQAVNDKNLKNK